MISVKKFAESLDKKPVAVFGLGKSGLSVIRALSKEHVKVFAWDDNEDRHVSAKEAGAVIKDLDVNVLQKCACLVLAPGVPLSHPEPHDVVKAAQEAGIEIIGDVEIFHRSKIDRKTIALTGTNGKSTTAALMHHILNECERKSALGGNFGTPVLDTKMPAKDGAFVLELSSFQLDLCAEFTADIAMLLNITPDHIDRHGSLEGYIAAKEKIFQGPGTAIICTDDEHTKAIFERVVAAGERRVIPVSVTEEVEGGYFVRNGTIVDTTSGEFKEAGSINNIVKLHGLHNHQNAIVAYAAARAMDLDPDHILNAIRSYPGLAHRQYPVRVINGVAYINDSKATNADATAKALGAFRNIYWIVGGRSKEGGLNGLERYIEHIKAAFLIGESMENFIQWMADHGVDYYRSKTLDIALEQAHSMAQEARGQPGGSGAVILSPACSSYDQFASFEERGNVFTDLVLKLPDES